MTRIASMKFQSEPEMLVESLLSRCKSMNDVQLALDCLDEARRRLVLESGHDVAGVVVNHLLAPEPF